ncbi:hypothetical protein E0493_21095 [Roseomonas sp. M0104]|uniref:Argininosuccinate lyase n=1 Tax=Teichococcus coralli TaxID=2545983 RepID=A0A845BFH5_9PROT|nr:hypothetical protein [Pseudoroseomonas coralli]MXP65851.1 hypothetical protein [Pseudoroseomonas coralli]
MRVPFALALLALAVSSVAHAQSALDFRLVNRTGYQIDEVYVSPASSSSWGDDIMGRDAVPDGSTVNVTFNPRARTCKWDLKVVYEDGDESEWEALNLCSVSKVTLFWNRRAGTTRAVTE